MDAYVGRPGHGKSYSVVEYVIIPSLKSNRHVITNIPLFVDDLVSVYGGQITQLPLDWADDADWASTIPNGAVLVLDEVWRRFPSGQKVTAANPDDLALFKEHRHRVDSDGNSMRIVLVTQDTSDLSSWVRKLVDHTFVMNKLADAGASNRFRVDIYQGCPTGERIPKRLLIRSTYGTYKPEIYRYYSSATQSETGQVGDESAADTRTNIWRSTALWLALGGGVIALGAGAVAVLSFFTPDVQEQSSDPELTDAQRLAMASQQNLSSAPAPTRAPRQEPPPPPPPPSPDPATPPPSTMWRVVGYIGASDHMPPSPWRRSDQSGSGPDPYPQYPVDQSDQSAHASLAGTQPLVILAGITGLRYVPLSDCQPYADGINYRCDIDGERVTPWSGQLSITSTFERSAGSSETVAAAEASGATESRGGGF